ncbi:MAG: glycoside hydrolase family 2 [Verrucomicrobia bacterium]|nr:glycoside hydrolase family 2 [Verrucomicrobiota bacterium]
MKTCSRRRAKLTGWLGVILAGCVVAAADSPPWRAAQGPLMTRWAEEVGPTNALPEYPRPQLVRPDWQNLNGLWDYAIVPLNSNRPPVFEGQILVPFPIESALSGVMRRLNQDQALWYRRAVGIPSDWRGRRVRLHFDAADWHTRVFVNGSYVGEHRGGYDRFSFDITDRLRWNGAEEILVAVSDPTEGDQPRGKQSRRPEGIFYTPSSGIWRTVWLEPVPAPGLDALRITPDLDSSAVRVRASVNSLAENLRIEAVAFADGSEMGRVTGLPNAELVLPLRTIRPWSPDEPFLYDLRVSLVQSNRVQDRVTSYFGMRKVALSKDSEGFTRITLNDQFVFQVGTLDQGFWPDGLYTAPTDAALRSDIEFLKQAGFNLTRKHVKVEPERWYYWCDKLGLLVWQDMPSGDNASVEGRRHFEAELLHMVQGLHHHPSIILWVLFNEGWGQYETERLTQLLKTLDPSRLVINASGWTDMRVGDVVDVHSYPGPDSPDPESRRASVLGEFGGLGLALAGHAWSARSWGYLMLKDEPELAARYTRLLRQVWDLQEWRGLSAAVYTQTSDVETECNGLLTYDRVMKLSPAIIRAANRREPRGEPRRLVLPDAMLGHAVWKYTIQPPGDDWFKPGFDDSTWKEAPGGFGVAGTPGARANTVWETADIWLRREFGLEAGERAGLKLRVYHDEDAMIYLNGVLAAKLPGHVVEYIEVEVSEEALVALRPGRNTVAVHCRQTTGGQGIDVGILVTKAAKPPENNQ